MNLYIMRHGIAYDHGEWEGSDSDRPLTETGRERVRQVVARLRKSGELAVDAIWSSPLVRARETAEIAGEQFGMTVKIVAALQCGADLSQLMKYARKDIPPARLLTVGHEPDCAIILGELMGNETTDLGFRRAGIAHVEGALNPGGMKMVWKYAPKDVLGD